MHVLPYVLVDGVGAGLTDRKSPDYSLLRMRHESEVHTSRFCSNEPVNTLTELAGKSNTRQIN